MKRIVASLFILFPLSCLATNSPDERTFTLTLKPVLGANARVSAIEVHEVVNGVLPKDGSPFSLIARLEYVGIVHIADRITGLEVSDARGPVGLNIKDDSVQAGSFGSYRHWRATRVVEFPISIRYRANVEPGGSPVAPPLAIRPAGQGVAGAGAGFLLLPENSGTTESKLHWDLSGLAAGSIGVASSGEGDVSLAGPPSNLTDQWILAGPTGKYESRGGATSFAAYWLGRPPFDPIAEMHWAADAYAFLGKSFRYLNPSPPYRVFIKVVDEPPIGNGTALPGGFLLEIGNTFRPGFDRDRVRDLIFHEMTHPWVGHIQDSSGAETEGASWFSEGLTVFFTTTLPARGNLVSVEQYRKMINEVAQRYYGSPSAELVAIQNQ